MNTAMNLTPISISELRHHLRIARLTKTNLLALGNPGIGKTDSLKGFLEEIAEEENLTGDRYPQLVTKVLSTFDRVDFVMSAANREKGVLEELVTEWVADLSNEHNPDGPVTILYMNEVNSAPESLHSVLYRLLEERALGNVTLRDNVTIFADGNPPGRGMVSQALSTPMKRRFCTVLVKADREEWLDWAMRHDVDGAVLAFLSQPNHADHFDNFDNMDRMDNAWANPASWTKLSKALPHLANCPARVQLSSYEGWVGKAAGGAFHAWMQVGANAPSYKDFLKNPDSIGFDDLGADVQWFLVSQVGNATTDSKADAALIDSALSLAYWLGSGKNKEFAFFLTRFMVSRQPKLVKTMAKHPRIQDLAKLMASCPIMMEVFDECFKAA